MKCIYCNDPIYDSQVILHDGCAGLREGKLIIKRLREWKFGNRYAGIGEEVRDDIISALEEEYKE